MFMTARGLTESLQCDRQPTRPARRQSVAHVACPTDAVGCGYSPARSPSCRRLYIRGIPYDDVLKQSFACIVY